MQNLETGDILLEKGTNLIAWGVRLFTISKYSHVAIVVEPEEDKIIQAHLGKGVYFSKISELEKFDTFRVKGGLSVREQVQLKEEAEKLKGYRYDGSQILGYIIQAFFGGYRWLNSPTEFVCSELAERLYLPLGFEMFKYLDVPRADLQPKHIAKVDFLEKV